MGHESKADDPFVRLIRIRRNKQLPLQVCRSQSAACLSLSLSLSLEASAADNSLPLSLAALNQLVRDENDHDSNDNRQQGYSLRDCSTLLLDLYCCSCEWAAQDRAQTRASDTKRDYKLPLLLATNLLSPETITQFNLTRLSSRLRVDMRDEEHLLWTRNEANEHKQMLSKRKKKW